MVAAKTSSIANGPALSCACCAPRRGFLGRMAALGAAAALPGLALPAQPKPARAPAKPYRIDVHHHLLPPGYLEEVAKQRVGSNPRPWTPETSIQEMDAHGIATSVVSVIQPGVSMSDVPTGRRVARSLNEYAAKMVADYPGRFGMFAQLPLLDIEGSLAEIVYSMDSLKADGIGLMTSYGDKWLGDAMFGPVWEELNRRKAAVYTHPLSPDCCKNLMREVPPSTIEYATDTTRTVASLLFSGTAAKYPDIRFIFSHSGGTTPFLVGRFQRQEEVMKDRERRLPKGVMHELQKLYYDTAQGNTSMQLAALMKYVAPSQVLFGTDFPLRPAAEEIEGLAAFRFSAKVLRAIERDNALRLLPRLKG